MSIVPLRSIFSALVVSTRKMIFFGKEFIFLTQDQPRSLFVAERQVEIAWQDKSAILTSGPVPSPLVVAKHHILDLLACAMQPPFAPAASAADIGDPYIC